MKLTDITEQSLKEINLLELLNIHKHVHSLWAGLKHLTQEKAEEQRDLLLKVHNILAGEMKRRNVRHNTRLEKSDDGGTIDDTFGWDYFETFRNLYPWQIEDAGSIVRILQKYYCTTVLDVGCGVGWLLALLKGWFEPTGIEPAEAAVEFGRRKKFNVYQGYGEELPFVDEFFDGVITNHVLEHVPEPIKVISECARVSRRVSVHIVPLGKREDPTHIHEYSTLEELMELGEDIIYPTRFEKSVYNNAIIIVAKTIRPAGIFKDYSDIVLVPDYISEVGSTVKQEKKPPKDIDIVIRAAERDPLLETEIRNHMKKKAYDKTEWIYRPTGPIGAHLPLFDLVLKSKEVMMAKETKGARKPLWTFIPPKPSRAFYLYDDADINKMWEDWCEERKIVDVELKYNGFRGVIEKNTEGDILIFFEGDRKNRAKQFPALVREMKKISGAYILDCDIGAIGTDKKPLSRIDLQGLNNIGNVIEGAFVTKKGVEGRLRVVVFDVLYRSDSVTHMPWTERRKILDSLHLGKLKILTESKATIARSKGAFINAVKRYSNVPRSEGVVIKDVTGQYVGFGSTNLHWAKGKTVGIIRTRISGKESVTNKPGTYSYEHECKQGEGWLALGKTMNTSLSLSKGDIAEVRVEEIIPEVEDDILQVSVVIPVIKKKSNRGANDVRAIIREGKRANILQTNPDIDEYLSKKLRFTKGEYTREEYIEFRKKLSDKQLEEYDEETALINENKKKPLAEEVHEFKAAKWTHPNGHPRCLICGDEEPIGGVCNMPDSWYGKHEFDDEEAWEKEREILKKKKILHKARHKHTECMECSKPPVYECRWANGYAHAWFCKKHFEEWFTTGDGKDEILSVKEVVDGKAAKEYKENPNPNIWNKAENEFVKKEGNIDLEEGWSGTGVLQLHIMGMTKEEADDYVKTRSLKGKNPAHLDFRLLPTNPKKSYWEGGELFTPASTAKSIKIYDCKLGITKIMFNFKLESETGGHEGTPGKIMRASNMSWLRYGLSKVKTFLPGQAGTVGTTPEHFAVMDGIGTFKWQAGVQDEHFKEFLVKFNSGSKEYDKLKKLDGRIVCMFAPLPSPEGKERRVWLMMKPKDQKMKSELFYFTKGKEARKFKKRK